MLREIEVAAARLAHVVLPTDDTIAGMFLPVSKADVGGCGVLRLRICSHDTEERGADSCAVCTLRALTKSTADLGYLDLPGENNRWAEPAWEAPLFPTVAFKTPEKEAVVRGPSGHEIVTFPRRGGLYLNKMRMRNPRYPGFTRQWPCGPRSRMTT